MEKRRKEPSYIIPISYFLLEVFMIWLLISLFNWDINIMNWNIYSYGFLLLWLVFISAKLYLVLKRQKAHND